LANATAHSINQASMSNLSSTSNLAAVVGGLAARIAAEARGGEILVSRLVRELTEGASLFSFTDPTDVELKGLSGMHSLSAVRWQTEA